MQILVITSCTSKKKYKTTNQLQYEDFISSDRLQQREAELIKYKSPAAEMYTGQQHLYLMDGLKQLRETYGQTVADLSIISAGYGLLSENDVIVPYNVTFQKLTRKDKLERSENLHIHEQVGNQLVNYDLVFYLLGKEYVQALQLPFKVPDSVSQIFLLGDSYNDCIPDLPNTHFVPAGKPLADKLGTNTRILKGVVFNKLCDAACRDGFQVFEEVKNNPQRLIEIVLQDK